MTIFLVHGQTESGDYWSMAFKNDPSHGSIIWAIEQDPWLRGEYEDGCIQGWETVKVKLIDNS